VPMAPEALTNIHESIDERAIYVNSHGFLINGLTHSHSVKH